MIILPCKRQRMMADSSPRCKRRKQANPKRNNALVRFGVNGESDSEDEDALHIVEEEGEWEEEVEEDDADGDDTTIADDDAALEDAEQVEEQSKDGEKWQKCPQGSDEVELAKSPVKGEGGSTMLPGFSEFLQRSDTAVVYPEDPEENPKPSITDRQKENELPCETDSFPRILSCPYCERGYKRLASLKDHVKYRHVQSDDCSLCSSTCNSRVQLHRHITTAPRAAAQGQNESRKFRCSVCSKAFKYKHHLKEHFRIHSGEKPYECPNCKKRFSHSGSYSSHISNMKCTPQTPTADTTAPASTINGQLPLHLPAEILTAQVQSHVALKSETPLPALTTTVMPRCIKTETVSAIVSVAPPPPTVPLRVLPVQTISGMATRPIATAQTCLTVNLQPLGAGQQTVVIGEGGSVPLLRSVTPIHVSSVGLQQLPVTTYTLAFASTPLPGTVKSTVEFSEVTSKSMPLIQQSGVTKVETVTIDGCVLLPQEITAVNGLLGVSAQLLNGKKTLTASPCGISGPVTNSGTSVANPMALMNPGVVGIVANNTNNANNVLKVVQNVAVTSQPMLISPQPNECAKKTADAKETANCNSQESEVVDNDVEKIPEVIPAPIPINIASSEPAVPTISKSLVHCPSELTDDKQGSEVEDLSQPAATPGGQEGVDGGVTRHKSPLCCATTRDKAMSDLVGLVRDLLAVLKALHARLSSEDGAMSLALGNELLGMVADMEEDDVNRDAEDEECANEGRPGMDDTGMRRGRLGVHQLSGFIAKLLEQVHTELPMETRESLDKIAPCEEQCVIDGCGKSVAVSQGGSAGCRWPSTMEEFPLDLSLPKARKPQVEESDNQEEKEQQAKIEDVDKEKCVEKSYQANIDAESMETTEEKYQKGEEEVENKNDVEALEIKSSNLSLQTVMPENTKGPELVDIKTEGTPHQRIVTTTGESVTTQAEGLCLTVPQPPLQETAINVALLDGTPLIVTFVSTGGFNEVQTAGGSIGVKRSTGAGPIAVIPSLTYNCTPSTAPVSIAPAPMSISAARKETQCLSESVVEGQSEPEGTQAKICRGETPNYACDLCDKTFQKSSSLIRHKYEHTGKRPHACHVCNKAFKHKHHLMEHSRLHSGEKPYRCDRCGKRFSHSGSYSQHMNHRYSYCRREIDGTSTLAPEDATGTMGHDDEADDGENKERDDDGNSEIEEIGDMEVAEEVDDDEDDDDDDDDCGMSEEEERNQPGYVGNLEREESKFLVAQAVENEMEEAINARMSKEEEQQKNGMCQETEVENRENFEESVEGDDHDGKSKDIVKEHEDNPITMGFELERRQIEDCELVTFGDNTGCVLEVEAEVEMVEEESEICPREESVEDNEEVQSTDGIFEEAINANMETDKSNGCDDVNAGREK
uniref:zinc finger E-box-binding homeobox 1-like isoform X2 n=1 Tax=Myxine glutinosa TaxID=7769 RepID=UPI00358ED8EC